MDLSRRSLLRGIGVAAVAGATSASARELPFTESAAEQLAGRAEGPIRLNRNENPYGPSARVFEAMRGSLNGANRYPDATESLVKKIAETHGVEPQQIILGCGSTEILHMAAAAFLGPGVKLVTASPTFDSLARFARRWGTKVVAVPLRKDYAHDLAAMLAQTDAVTGLVYICNPNNPTGSITPRKEIEEFLAKLPETAHVLIDEAYHHYVGGTASYASFIDRPVKDPRVIVSRTFSKIHGLAGLRVGYAAGSKEGIERVAGDGMQFSVNTMALRAAAAALDDAAYVKTSAQRNANDRQELYNQANARMLRAIDSQANFAMLNVARPAASVIEHFSKNNVLVAPPVAGMNEYIRVSLGTPREMREFWRVWDLLVPHGMKM